MAEQTRGLSNPECSLGGTSMAERIFDRRRFLGAAALAGLAAAGSAGMATAAAARPSHADPAPRGDDFGLDARSFGARADGKTDDTAAIQKALDAAGKQGGGVVRLPVGHYLLRGSLRVPECVTLQGVFRALQSGSGSVSTGVVPYSWRGGGSVLLALGGRGRPDSQAFISLHRSSTLYGVSIFYPEQHPSRPVEYPWAVRQMAQDICVEDVLLVNPWQGVDCGTVLGQRHYIHGLYGQPLKTGIFIDRCADTGVVENVHFWPFWKPTAMEFTSRHTTAFLIGRTDWQYMMNCFAIAHKIGYHFVHTPAGAPNVLLTQCGSDEGAPGTKSISVLVESGKAGGVSFLNGQFGGSPSVYVTAGNTGTVKFTNCAFGAGPMTDSVVVLEDGIASFTNCRFSGWPRKAPTIVARGGGLMVQGCAFVSTGGRHVALERGAGAAVIVGNLFHGRMRIRNQIGNRAKIGLNAAS